MDFKVASLFDFILYGSYYPFGMVTPGRSFAAGDGYRFGFYGMESQGIDCGCDGVYTSYFRQYDQRIGRWWSIDPKYKVYHGLTPYANNFNNPIKLYDPLGDCPPLNVGCQIVKKVYKRIAKTETQTKKYVEKKNEINNPYKNPDYSYKPEVREEQNANVDAQAKSYVVKESGRVLEGTFTVIGNVPGMETASDAILATYNYIQGDNEEALAYAAGLVLPGLSGTQLEKIKIAAPHLHHILPIKTSFEVSNGQKSLNHYLTRLDINYLIKLTQFLFQDIRGLILTLTINWFTMNLLRQPRASLVRNIKKLSIVLLKDYQKRQAQPEQKLTN